MICVENVAEAIAGALDRGEAGARYPVGDVDIRWKEMFAIMFTALGIHRRFIHVPYWIASIATTAKACYPSGMNRKNSLP